MSRAKGNQAAGWVADYLRRWWPSAEKTPNGYRGRDILGTPGVAIEVKTGATWREDWLDQAAGYAGAGEVAMLVYLPPGIGKANVASAQAVFPLSVAIRLLQAAGYAPHTAEEAISQIETVKALYSSITEEMREQLERKTAHGNG